MCTKEIGSEFWSVPVCEDKNTFLPDDVSWFLSGRNALQAIIKANNFKSVALPSWCCDSMIGPFISAGVEVRFYSVSGAKQSIKNINADALLVMDYFGYSGYSHVPDDFKGIVIRDITHSVFSGKYDDADYYFGSLRKWCGFRTGGFAYSKKKIFSSDKENGKYIALRRQAMEEKEKYINGVSDSKDYLNIFNCAENQLDNLNEIFAADKRDIDLALRLDTSLIIEKRRKNASVLIDELSEYCIFKDIKHDDCPLFVPIRVKNRDALRRLLTRNNIYCPIHWSLSDYHKSLNEDEVSIYKDEISLVCDQRYDEKDMKRITEVIKDGIKILC